MCQVGRGRPLPPRRQPARPSYSSQSSVYFETPSPTDKIDTEDMQDHIEVYELTFGPEDEQQLEDEDPDLLEKFYAGERAATVQPSRRPNSYFYDEVSQQLLPELTGEVTVESVTAPRTATTPVPLHEEPLPTYKAYVASSTVKEILGKSTTTPTPPTTTTSTYFPSTPQPTLVTFQPYFQQGPTVSTAKLNPFTATTARPSVTVTTMSLAGEDSQQPVQYQTRIFQQLGNKVQVNISNPSEKSWEAVVTRKPELNRSPSPTPTSPSLSTTQLPATTPALQNKVFVTAKPDWSIRPTKQLTTPTTTTTTSRSKPKQFDKKDFSYNTGIQWGKAKQNLFKTKLKTRNWQRRKANNKKRVAAGLKPGKISGRVTRKPLLPLALHPTPTSSRDRPTSKLDISRLDIGLDKAACSNIIAFKSNIYEN